MVKHKQKVTPKIFAALAILSVILFNIKTTSADDTNFQVNVKEVLSVTISAPTASANGGVDEFLRSSVNLAVSSNNSNGFRASMYSNTEANDKTSLVNTNDSAYELETLGATSQRSAFPSNRWGYSLGTTATLNNLSYNETAEGNASSNYHPVSASTNPITVLSSANAASGNVDIYFGAKANINQASGTYTGAVVISVVSGTIDVDNPAVPTDPATPNADDEVAIYNEAPTGGSTSGTTTYTTRDTNTSATTTQVSEGDNTAAYEAPQGVTTTSSISTGSKLATGLAATAAAAAASGLFFLLLAKRNKDDDEENQQ